MTNSIRNTYMITPVATKMQTVSIINVMSVETEETIHTRYCNLTPVECEGDKDKSMMFVPYVLQYAKRYLLG